MNNTEHKGPLIGRIFLICEESLLPHWLGYVEDSPDESDYDAIADFIVCDAAGFSSYQKPDGAIFYIFFSMSQKVELFTTADSAIVTEGLFFNRKLKEGEINFISTGNIQTIKINTPGLVLFEAPFSGMQVKNQIAFNERATEYITYKKIDLKPGNYTINRIEAEYNDADYSDTLEGIEVKLISESN
jgi:hypothetical protein